MCQIARYGIHTGDYKHRISEKEAKYIKHFFGYRVNEQIIDDESLFKSGIKFSILEEAKYYSTKNNDSDIPKNIVVGTDYHLLIKLNHSCVIGENGNLVMELSPRNIRKMIKAVNRILKSVFKLEEMNADFMSWSIERIDDGFDLYLYDDTRLYVYLLNASLQLPQRKRCVYYKEDEMTPDCDRAFESVYFYNNSYAINAYAKWYELRKKNPNIPESDPTYDLLRIERQNQQQCLKEFMPNRKVSDLLEKGNVSKMLYSLKENIKAFWGMGDFYDTNYYLNTSRLVNSVPDKYLKTSSDLLNGGRLYTHKNMDKKALEWFNYFQIAPALISPSLKMKFGITRNDKPYSILGLYNMIDFVFPDSSPKRTYHSFAIPHYDEKRGDWRVSMTVHINRLNKGEPDSASGKTFDACQRVMFEKLKRHYETNKFWGWNNDGLRKDLNNFYKTVKSKEIKKDIRDYLERNGE